MSGSGAALLRDLEALLSEVRTGFTFVERQKQVMIDGKDLHFDLLFYHRPLRVRMRAVRPG